MTEVELLEVLKDVSKLSCIFLMPFLVLGFYDTIKRLVGNYHEWVYFRSGVLTLGDHKEGRELIKEIKFNLAQLMWLVIIAFLFIPHAMMAITVV